jgi:multidrug efflux system membrane fusion protein
VRVRLRVGPPHRALLVNEKALGTDQGQKCVYVVEDGNKAGYRRVKLGQVFDSLQAIEGGLKAEDRVVVNGLQRVRPGMEVHAEEVDMRTLAPPTQTEPRAETANPASPAPAKQ